MSSCFDNLRIGDIFVTHSNWDPEYLIEYEVQEFKGEALVLIIGSRLTPLHPKLLRKDSINPVGKKINISKTWFEDKVFQVRKKQ